MATRQADSLALVARARRIQWPVENNESGGYKVICPDGYPVPVHLTYSDVRSLRNTEAELNRHGFKEAEQAWLKADEADRQKKLKANRDKEARDLKRATDRAATLAKAAGPYGQSQVTIGEILADHPAPMTYTRVLVTPDMARAMLTRNEPTEAAPWENRRMSGIDVAVWESVLRSNRWLYTHQGVAFDWTGRLQDGQTRLTAIAQSGVAAELMVSVGMDPRNFPVIDGNRKRTAGQVLRMLGFANSNPVSSAVRLIYLHEVWKGAILDHHRQRVPNDIIAEVADKLDQDDLEAAMDWATQLRREGVFGALPAPAAAMYAIRIRLPKDDPRVEEFARLMVEGVVGEGREDHPVYQLRRQMSRQGTSPRRLVTAEMFALIIKGWNAFADEYARGVYEGQHFVVARGSRVPGIFLPPPIGTEVDEVEETEVDEVEETEVDEVEETEVEVEETGELVEA